MHLQMLLVIDICLYMENSLKVPVTRPCAGRLNILLVGRLGDLNS